VPFVIKFIRNKRTAQIKWMSIDFNGLTNGADRLHDSQLKAYI